MAMQTEILNVSLQQLEVIRHNYIFIFAHRRRYLDDPSLTIALRTVSD